MSLRASGVPHRSRTGLFEQAIPKSDTCALESSKSRLSPRAPLYTLWCKAKLRAYLLLRFTPAAVLIWVLQLIQGSDNPRSNTPGNAMEIEDAPYSRDEVLRFHLEPPKRGRLCPKCGVRVPQFVDLNRADLSRLRNLVIDHQPVLAVKELRSITGCCLPWAKIWVQHEGQAREETRPCPYCAKPLRTPAAQQCRFCLMDWHDPENPHKMTPPITG